MPSILPNPGSMAGRPCRVCGDRRKSAINEFILAVSAHAAAKKFGLPPRSVLRHARQHLPGYVPSKSPIRPKPEPAERDFLDLEAVAADRPQAPAQSEPELPALPAELIPPDEGEVRFDSLPAIVKHLEAEARAARRIRLQAEARQDDRMVLAGVKVGIEAGQAAKACLPKPDQGQGNTLHFSITMSDGTKLFDTTFLPVTKPEPEDEGEGDGPDWVKGPRGRLYGRRPRRDDRSGSSAPIEPEVEDPGMMVWHERRARGRLREDEDEDGED